MAEKWPEAPRLTLDGPLTFSGDLDYLVALARAGNIAAARLLVRAAAGHLVAGMTMPAALADWLADALEAALDDPAKAGAALGIARGAGRPAPHKESIRGGLARSIERGLVDMLRAQGLPVRDRTGPREDELGPAIVGAFEAARGLGIETDPRATRDAYYPRRRKRKRGGSGNSR